MSLLITEAKDKSELVHILPCEGNRIPKIIHYCWFGGKPLPEGLKKCLNSWSICEGYTIMRWDESNCSFDENEFIKKAYQERRFAFISDYYRLKALYQYGGVYLDTDVILNRSFDDLLKYKAFLNFITDCSVGTAVIGSERNGKLIGALLNMYDNSVMRPRSERVDRKELVTKDGKIYVYGFPTNNYFFTYYILKEYPQFRLNNKYQDIGDFVIYPKELFEIGTITGKHYSIHLCDGEWRIKKEQTKGIKKAIKRLVNNEGRVFRCLQVLIRKRRYWKMKKSIPFYPYYLAQRNNTDLPEI